MPLLSAFWLFLIPFLQPSLQENVPTYLPLPYQMSPLPGASGLSRVRIRYIFSHWGQTRQSSAVNVLGASYQLVYAAWVVAQCLRDLGGHFQ